MPTLTSPEALQTYLSSASISPEIFTLRPDYRAVLLAVSGLHAKPSDATSEAFLNDAESFARAQLAAHPVQKIPHVAAWQEAYKAFGAKPKKHMNSLEALTRRIGPEKGLPRVNRLTDIYNAISVKHHLPLGGEDLEKYSGPPRLIRATGEEDFEVKEKGNIVVEHPDAGEVVWVDDMGVTCRRWNWRQGPRTALTDETTSALFICDALGAMDDGALEEAVGVLVDALKGSGDDVLVAKRIIKADSA